MLLEGNVEEPDGEKSQYTAVEDKLHNSRKYKQTKENNPFADNTAQQYPFITSESSKPVTRLSSANPG
jgi:hypothetical protein